MRQEEAKGKERKRKICGVEIDLSREGHDSHCPQDILPCFLELVVVQENGHPHEVEMKARGVVLVDGLVACLEGLLHLLFIDQVFDCFEPLSR